MRKAQGSPACEASNAIVRVVGDLHEPVHPDAKKLLGPFAVNRAVSREISHQIAWTASPAGMRKVIERLDSGLRSPEPAIRRDSADFVAAAAAYVHGAAAHLVFFLEGSGF